MRRKPDVGRFNAVLVDVNVQVLTWGKKSIKAMIYHLKIFWTYLPIRKSSCLAEQDQLFEEEYLPERFLAGFSLPDEELVLP